MKVTARFRVNISGWVTVTREVEAFDPEGSRMDFIDSLESGVLDSMADEAIERASDRLGGDVDDHVIVSVTP